LSVTPSSPYRAPWWLPEGHSQTIFPALAAPKPLVSYQRERWDTPDGDFIDLDWVASTKANTSSPLVVLFHGLEGSSQSHYARALMAACEARGWRGVVSHFRGCSGQLNRLPRAYHSGDSQEIAWVLNQLKARHAPNTSLFASGVSLGGNALAKHLGEAKEATVVTRAAVVSAPVNLHAGAQALSRGFNLIYTHNFLTTLKKKSLEKWHLFPGCFDKEKMLASTDFFGFDEHVTAPLHGFGSAMEYWQRSSCGPYLKHITVPTLVLNARNDPFLPAENLPSITEVSKHVVLEQPASGGHVGFLVGAPPGQLQWLSARILAHFHG
jgi:uncharacterized protein